MHQIRFEVQRLPLANIIHLDGAIDWNNFAPLAIELQGLLASSLPRVILECSHVSYIGTAELKRLLDYAHRARAAGGDIKCAGLAPTIEQVATLIANGDPLECYPGIVGAIAGFQPSAVPVG
jgi:anti-anti-sigma factor